MNPSETPPPSIPAASAATDGTVPAGFAGLTRLADWGVIRAAGADARRFLHGQLTQDVEHLALEQARLAGFCSAKGRLQASFVIWRDGDDDVLLACSADLLAATLKRLSMFVLRAKCKLSDASAEVPLWGLAGAAPQTAGEVWSHCSVEGQTVLRLPDALVDGTRIERRLVAGDTPPDAPTAAPGSWAWLEVHSGVPRIVAATAELFVPQMVNLDLVGGVDFQKGCYPGQEVVARSQYRGTLKRRAQVLTGGARLAPAAEIFHSADPDQPAGRVVLGAEFAGRCAVLAELKLAALDAGALSPAPSDQAGSEPAVLALVPLLYPIPVEQG
ncbi:MAG: folate-binding protein [Rubrivivax sp.]